MKCVLCRKVNERALCSNCWDYALGKLKAFPDRYEELDEELMPSSGARSERVGGSKNPPLPVRLETLELRSGGISKPLTKHEAKIRIEQRHTRITFRGEEINRITKTCTYITAQGEWIFHHYDDAPSLAKDINDIHNRINAVLGYKSDLMTIGTCPSQGEDGTACGAKLQINPATLTTFGDIKCRACGSVWASEQWRLLGRVLNDNNR